MPLVAVFGSTAGFPHANERPGFHVPGTGRAEETLERTRGVQLWRTPPVRRR